MLIGLILLVINAFYRNKCGACFSDAKMFYAQRFIDGNHAWPYSPLHIPGLPGIENGIEYPALTGFVLWIMSFITPQSSMLDIEKGAEPWINFFNINSFVNGTLLLLSIYVIGKKFGPKAAMLLAVSPSVAFATATNFDMWAVYSGILSLIYLRKSRDLPSALFLAIAISFKFYPVFFLLPILIYFERTKLINRGSRYL